MILLNGIDTGAWPLMLMLAAKWDMLDGDGALSDDDDDDDDDGDSSGDSVVAVAVEDRWVYAFPPEVDE